ncbi:MAG: sulfatase-like hydrolase/transferase [Verrucomicrobia bacterium]|nr:sulfatase-like hydrolase/transferase [Verrucomicrobiota bacterium]
MIAKKLLHCRGFFLLALTLSLSAVPFLRAAERFNLIAIVTDDQGRWSLGCYGNKDSITPHMDRLAREGALFVNAFTATPVCSPSRTTYLTGRWGTQVGITDYLAPVEETAGFGLGKQFTTWPEVLRKNGYVTGLVGKWHMGNKPEFHPTKHGFDYFAGFIGGGTLPMNPAYEVDGETKQREGAEPEVAVDHALKFIEANQAKPFALSLHFRAPHLPYGPVPEQDSAPFKNLDPTVPMEKGLDIAQVKSFTKAYYASIHSVDRNLGRLFARLEAMGLMERTIIMFTSDHGYNIGHHLIHTKGNGYWIAGGVNGPKRPNMWETSIRIPLLVRWPGVVKPGTRITEPVSNLDTFASVLGMLGVPMPSDVKQLGLNFTPLLRGQKVPWRDTIYGQFDLHNQGLAYMRMIRTGKWKLVRHNYTNGLDELYDLENDPDERKNLYANPQHETVRAELQAKLTEWQRSIDDPVLHAEAGKTYPVQRVP